MSDDQRELLTLADAAARLQVDVKTIRRYIGNGRLVGYRLGPKLLRVDAASVDQLLKQVPTTQSLIREHSLPAADGFRQRLEVDHMWPPNAIRVALDEHRKLRR